MAAAAAEALDEREMLDLSSRFITNLPNEELGSFERLFFQLEQAHWFHVDFYDGSLTNLRDFCREFFQRSPVLVRYKNRFDQLFDQFQDYLGKVPVIGAILLNEDRSKMLLVRGWKARSWGFPKGKVNKGEPDEECAIRETYEEVGYDCRALLRPRDFIEIRRRGASDAKKRMRMYVVSGVSEDFPFQTQTRKEISEIRWFDVRQVMGAGDKASKGKVKSKFWGVRPFLGKLKKYVKRRGGGGGGGGKHNKQHYQYDADEAGWYEEDEDGWDVMEMFRVNERLMNHPLLTWRFDRADIMQGFTY